MGNSSSPSRVSRFRSHDRKFIFTFAPFRPSFATLTRDFGAARGFGTTLDGVYGFGCRVFVRASPAPFANVICFAPAAEARAFALLAATGFAFGWPLLVEPAFVV